MAYRTLDNPTVHYAKLNFTIYEIDLSRVKRLTNTPPFFLTVPPEKITQYISNDPGSKIIKFYKAYDTFEEQEIFVKTGGDFDKEFMVFDPTLMELKLLILREEHYKTYNIEIILYDEFLDETKYKIELTLKKQDPFLWNVTKNHYSRDNIRPGDEVDARVKLITYNGYLYVSFNK